MKVLVSVPNQGWIHKLVVHACFKLYASSGYQITLITPTHRPYEHNLNRIAKDFLAGSWDYWLNIDADNPPIGDPLLNLGTSYDILGFPTPVWRDDSETIPLYWNAMKDEGDGYLPMELPGAGLFGCDAVGTGCVRFNRRVVAAVREVHGPPFIRTYDSDGLVNYGPDFLFCKRAKELGFKVGVDCSCPCRHFCEIDLCTAAQRMFTHA